MRTKCAGARCSGALSIRHERYATSGTHQTTKTSRRNPADLAGACSGGRFIVSSAGEAYDAQARGLNRKFQVNTAFDTTNKVGAQAIGDVYHRIYRRTKINLYFLDERNRMQHGLLGVTGVSAPGDVERLLGRRGCMGSLVHASPGSQKGFRQLSAPQEGVAGSGESHTGNPEGS